MASVGDRLGQGVEHDLQRLAEFGGALEGARARPVGPLLQRELPLPGPVLHVVQGPVGVEPVGLAVHGLGELFRGQVQVPGEADGPLLDAGAFVLDRVREFLDAVGDDLRLTR